MPNVFVTLKDMNITLLIFITAFLVLGNKLLYASDAEQFAKCTVTVAWKRTNAEDITATVTVHNGTNKTLVDPKVRVTFFDKDGKEVASAAKAYFATIPKGKSKRMEARIFSYIDTNAVEAKGAVEEGTLK
jgi:hypothetical protein